MTDAFELNKEGRDCEEELIARVEEHDQNIDPHRKKEIESFLAAMKAESFKIDPATAEVAVWRAELTDPYDIYRRPIDLDVSYCKHSFARNPGSDIWVLLQDLPPEPYQRLLARRRKKPERWPSIRLLLDWDKQRRASAARIAGSAGPTPEQWREIYNKRVALEREADQDCSVELAHARAFESCVVEYVFRFYHRYVPPSFCQRCMKPGPDVNVVMLPFGIENAGDAWIHAVCWPFWYDEEREFAESVLKAMGLGRVD